MDIIEFSDKQKSLRLKQEQVRKEMTALMERYKSLEKEIDNNENKALCNGTLDIKFGDFAKKVMETFKLPFNPKEITATTIIGPADIENMNNENKKSIMHTFQSTVIFHIGERFTFTAYIQSNIVNKNLSEIKENKPILLNNPTEIEINKNNLSTCFLADCNYNFGSPFNTKKFVNKILKDCFNDKVAQARENLYKPTPATTVDITNHNANSSTTVISR